MHEAFFIVTMVILLLIYWFSQEQQGRRIDDFSMQKDGYLFVVGSIFSILMIAVSIYKKEIINRIELGYTLFLGIGALAFLGNISPVLYYYDMYTRVLPFVCLFVVGIITTFYTPSGFIGVLAADKKDIRFASLKLLVIVVCGGLWSLFMKYYVDHLMIYFYLPFYVVATDYRRWGRQLRGEKVSSFKW